MRAAHMAEKRDSIAQRLKKSLEQEKDWQRIPRELASLGVHVGMLALRQDWSDPLKRAVAADLALRITEPEESLQKAFELFGLDSENPYDWRRLLSYFAESILGRRRPVLPKSGQTISTRILSAIEPSSSGKIGSSSL